MIDKNKRKTAVEDKGEINMRILDAYKEYTELRTANTSGRNAEYEMFKYAYLRGAENKKNER